MRYNRVLLLLIPAISAILLVTNYIIFFASSAQALSQTVTTECTGIERSCYTVSCANDQPCQTSSNQPSFVEPTREVTTSMQSVEETPVRQSVEETTISTDTAMQPTDDTSQQHIEVPVEFCNDGVDNDDDGKVDEECRAGTFSSASQNDLTDEEE